MLAHNLVAEASIRTERTSVEELSTAWISLHISVWRDTGTAGTSRILILVSILPPQNVFTVRLESLPDLCIC